MAELMGNHARHGRVDWIGARSSRRSALIALGEAEIAEAGLRGDHSRPGKRAVTLIQAEHLPVIAALCDGTVSPEALRRNLVVSGINLAALRGRDVALGGAVLHVTGPCAPCSRMEETLGPGGYSAVRHHGGWCASVVRPGRVGLGDAVVPC
ncbi:MOSC domain-containing protein [Jannaschia seohaensis]|uniref:MOSC domain-containing protein n=1 Tax=Jannaschia seohaensis TaxID=475081 RepID=A0A2Y9C2T3_9RHOB|nr:MOSC domain-containing protein [Jannaschia seohaensis]PWJ14498.1 MOSC domain-containing protein [Jannaschia seohaensis]SSA50262.1 MOSC domain-containing protein [Jannaschia seohaensis]